MVTHRLVAAASLAAALVLPAAAFAQQQPAPPAAPAGAAQPAHGHHGHHGHRGFRAALKGITLSDAQKAQLKDLMTQQRQQFTPGQQVDPATRKANREAFMQKVEAILTPAQRAQFEQNLQQMRAREQQERANGGAPQATPGQQ